MYLIYANVRMFDPRQLLVEAECFINAESNIGEHRGLLINFRFPRVK